MGFLPSEAQAEAVAPKCPPAAEGAEAGAVLSQEGTAEGQDLL